jgi:hypothetical protein
LQRRCGPTSMAHLAHERLGWPTGRVIMWHAEHAQLLLWRGGGAQSMRHGTTAGGQGLPSRREGAHRERPWLTAHRCGKVVGLSVVWGGRVEVGWWLTGAALR